jgi:hypothetical protein
MSSFDLGRVLVLHDPSARVLQANIAEFHARLPAVNAAAVEMAGKPAPDVTLELRTDETVLCTS